MGRWAQILWLGTVFFWNPISFGIQSACELDFYLLEFSSRLVGFSQRFHKEMAEYESSLSSLLLPAEAMDAHGPKELLNPADPDDALYYSEGGSNAGIWRVRLKSGESVAAKVIPLSQLGQAPTRAGPHPIPPERAEPLFLQRYLGELGLAPRLRGILNQAETKLWMKAAGIVPTRGFGETCVTVLMDPLEKVWNLPKSHGPPKDLGKWPLEKVKETAFQIRVLEAALDRLGVYPVDLQVFVLPKGGALLGDLDKYKVKGRDDMAKPPFQIHIRNLLAHWEALSGKKVSQKDREEIFRPLGGHVIP